MYRFDNDNDPAPAPDWLSAENRQADPFLDSRVLPDQERAAFAVANSDSSSVAEVEELMSFLDPDADGYDAWLQVLQALHDHFGGSAAGLQLAESWSQRGAKFITGEVATKWRGFRSGGGVTLRTIAMRARSNGANLSEIARRHRIGVQSRLAGTAVSEAQPDLSHDDLALDLGRRSWDADARYVSTWGKWLFWSGVHWQIDDTLGHMSRTRVYLRERSTELLTWADHNAEKEAGGTNDTAGRKLKGWAKDQAKALRSSATVVAVTSLARANPASAVTHKAFDADRFLLGTPGGTVDLRTGTLRAARRGDMISRLAACAPAAPGTHPDLWLQFLSVVFEGDQAVICFLQRAAGYALTGSIDEHKLLFLYGSGRNGKSVFLNTLLDLWGDYGRRVTATTFLNAQTERHPTDIAGLQGARLAVASELARGKTWDEAVIKDLTGGDRMTARFMRQDFFDFDPQLTLMIAGNTQPSFRGVDEAIRSRVVLVPFAVTIPPERRDGALPDKLRAEAPAILRWCIDGAIAWQENGLAVPPAIADASAAYFDDEDTLGQFLEDETIADPQAIATTDDLIMRFNYWSERQGLGSWTKRTLVKELKARGLTDAKTNGRRGLRGRRLA